MPFVESKYPTHLILTIRVIYTDFAYFRHPGVPIGYGDAMQRRLQRAKRRRQRPIPATVEEVAHLVEEYPEYR